MAGGCEGERERERLCHGRDPGHKWFLTRRDHQPDFDLTATRNLEITLASLVLLHVRGGWVEDEDEDGGLVAGDKIAD